MIALTLAALLLAAPLPLSLGSRYAQATDAAPATVGSFTAAHMVGLWGTDVTYGPEVQGPLVIRKGTGTWRAEIQGHSAPVEVRDGEWTFALPGERGSFRGQVDEGELHGFWRQAESTIFPDRYITPMTLRRTERGTWEGRVVPLAEQFSLYFEFVLVEGELTARMRNPEKNIGIYFDLGRAEVDGLDLLFFSANGEEVLFRGRIAASGDRWSIDFEGGRPPCRIQETDKGYRKRLLPSRC